MTYHITRGLRASLALALLAATLVQGAASAAGVTHAMLASGLVGQKSLLDLEDGEEEPLSKKPPKGRPSSAASSEVASDGEEPPVETPSLPPVVSDGAGELDDLLGDEGGKLEIETEQVCDLIRQKVGGNSRTLKVQLLRHPLKVPLPRGQEIDVMRLDASGKRPFAMTLRSEAIDNVSYYEERMLRRVSTELAEPLSAITRFDGFVDLNDPARLNRARRAIALLTIALAEHDSAQGRGKREGDGWSDLRFQLAQALFRLELSRVRMHFGKGQVQQAVAAGDRLLRQPDLGAGPRKLVRQLFDEMLLAPGADAAKQGDYVVARDALDAYAQRFPSQTSSRANLIRETLTAAAEAVVARAMKEKNPKLLDEAGTIWPHLEGLENRKREMSRDYPVLHCAYPTLPKSFSPLSARTPVERHATALMFESLVRWSEDVRAGSHYTEYLASTRPIPLARGREFRLPRAHWADSDFAAPHYCTTEDVLWTVRLLKKTRPFGFPSAWGRLVRDVTAADSLATDPFRVSIFLENDHWQPLSLMDFPILPKSSFPTCGEDPDELKVFAGRPVGTGPFLLRDPGGDGKSVRFVANPFYRHADRPHVREIQFHQMDSIEAYEEFIKGNVHLIYDVRPVHVVQLQQSRQKRRSTEQVIKLPTRSIHFLAPNYRRPSLRNADLRLAIAHAIERDKILDAHYRPGSATADHAALNGPFPTRSWAFNEDAPDYSPGSAATFATKAKQALGQLPKLRLMYPARNPDTGQACNEIQRQLSAVGIEIELESVEPNLFVQRVVEKHSFDLAYWRHDFKDETYWLWPLLDPADQDAGGANFLGYVPDTQLQDLFSRVLNHKSFRTIRDATHEIHKYIAREAVVIPLWELDTYVAVSQEVADARFSAQNLFEDIDRWILRSQ